MTRVARNPLPYLVIALLTGMLLSPFLLSFLDRSPLTFGEDPMPVVSPVHQGQPIVLTMTRCNETSHDIHYASTRVLRNADTLELYPLTPGGVNMPPGCETTDFTLNILPSNLPAGRYFIISNTVVNGAVKSFDANWTSAIFEVVP